MRVIEESTIISVNDIPYNISSAKNDGGIRTSSNSHELSWGERMYRKNKKN